MHVLFAKALAVWLLFLVAIVALGVVREKVLRPRLEERTAHQVGTVLACLAVLGVTFALLPWVGPSSRSAALGLGAFWLVLGIAFEFGFFHYARGVPWPVLLADYDLRRGRLLVILWLTVLLGPVLCFGLR